MQLKISNHYKIKLQAMFSTKTFTLNKILLLSVLASCMLIGHVGCQQGQSGNQTSLQTEDQPHARLLKSWEVQNGINIALNGKHKYTSSGLVIMLGYNGQPPQGFRYMTVSQAKSVKDQLCPFMELWFIIGLYDGTIKKQLNGCTVLNKERAPKCCGQLFAIYRS